jgi:hypothetical protein
MKPKITALFNKWQSQGLNLSKEEVKEELQRRGMKSMRAFGRWIQPDVFKKSSNVISKEGNDSDDSVLPVTRTLNKSSQIETSGCDRSRSIVNNTRQETVTLKRKRPWEDNVIVSPLYSIQKVARNNCNSSWKYCASSFLLKIPRETMFQSMVQYS